MAAAKDKKSVMDVSKPGKSPADATTRPIITGHTMMKDPMVTEDKPEIEGVVTEEAEKAQETTPEKVVAPSAAHRIIQPLDAAAEKPESTEEKPAEEAEPKEVEDQTEKKETPVTEDAVVDAVLDQVGDKKEETKESEEERKRQEIVDKLVEEKKYFVPIGQERKRRNSRLALLVIGALLPVIVGLGLAADAGAINLGFKVPFDFIKDKPTPAVTTTQAPQPVAKVVVTAPIMKGIADADTAKWTKLASDLKGFTLSIPDGWEVTNYKQENRVIAPAALTYAAGTPAKVSQGLSSVADIYRFDVIQFKLAAAPKYLDGDEQKQDFISGTLTGTRYYKKYPVVASAHGPIPGSERYVYEFKTKNTVTYISYVIVNYNQYTKDTVAISDLNQLALIEKLVKTLQIKE